MGLPAPHDRREGWRRRRRRKKKAFGDAVAGLSTGVACAILFILYRIYVGCAAGILDVMIAPVPSPRCRCEGGCSVRYIHFTGLACAAAGMCQR